MGKGGRCRMNHTHTNMLPSIRSPSSATPSTRRTITTSQSSSKRSSSSVFSNRLFLPASAYANSRLRKPSSQRSMSISVSSLSSPVRIREWKPPKPVERKEIRLRIHLKLVVRVIIWFRRKALSHQISNTNDKLHSYLAKFAFLDEAANPIDDDIIFRKERFKSDKECVVFNIKTLNLLDKKPTLRTEEDAHYVTCFLSNGFFYILITIFPALYKTSTT